MDVHWSDFSPSYTGDQDMEVKVGSHQRDRKRNRLEKVRLVNDLFKHYHLKLEDWNGSKYVLRNAKGKSEIVNDLGALWPAVERLSNVKPNPLNPDLLKTIRDTGEANV